MMAFHDLLVESLIKHGGVQPKIASKAVKNGYWTYLSKGIINKSLKKKDPPLLNLRLYLKENWPLVRNVFRQTKLTILRFGKSESLLGLLNTNSPDHSEFMSVYKFLEGYRNGSIDSDKLL